MNPEEFQSLHPDEEETLQQIIDGTFKPQTPAEKKAEMMAILSSADIQERIDAIIALGEVGDSKTLAALRERLDIVGQEYQALIVAIGTLKWRLGED